MLKKVGNQLRFHNKVTKIIGIKIRDASFNTKSRRISIDHFIDSDDEICFYALKIFDVFYNDQPIRLIGCMAEGCIDKGKETLVKKDEQLTIDEALYLNKKEKKLMTLMDAGDAYLQYLIVEKGDSSKTKESYKEDLSEFLN